MKKYAQLTEEGFTLVEMLVTMTIIGILALGIANFIVTWLASATLSSTKANLLSNAELALDTMSQDIRLSGDVDATNRWADTNGPGGNQYGWSSGTSTVILAKIATDKTNNVIYSDAAKYIPQKDDEIYYLSGTTLYRRTLKSDSANDSAVTTCPPASATASCPADTTIATNVSSWSVAYYDNTGTVTATPDNARSVQIAITISTKVNNRTVSQTYTTRMVFRNG